MELFTATNRILCRLNELERTIGDAANTALSLERAAQVQARANDVTHEILVRVGMQLDIATDDFDVRHETDELLKMAVVPNTTTTAREPAIPTNTTKDQEPIDVGPEGAADPILRLPTDDSEEYRADSSEEVSSPEIEALVAFTENHQTVDGEQLEQGNIEELITFETIDATDEANALDTNDEQDPAPLITPDTSNDIQWVVDDSPEDEPIETWDATATESDETIHSNDASDAIDDTVTDTKVDDESPIQARNTESEEVIDVIAAEAVVEETDLLPALSDDEDDELDTVRPGQKSPVTDVAVATRSKGASVRLKTIKVSKKTAAPRKSASIRVRPAAEPEEDVLALGDSYDFQSSTSNTTDSIQHPAETEEEANARFTLISESLDRAREALKEGALAEAVGFYSDVIDRDGKHYDAYLERGRVHLDLGDYGRAMSDFTVANDIHPENPNTGIALADLFFARKEYSRAIEFYTDALRELPEHAMAICRRGICHYYKRNFDKAMTDLENAYRLDKSIPNIATYVVMAKKKVKST